jgi:hypothetical protein
LGKAMVARVTEMTGINPFTIDQTTVQRKEGQLE